MGLKTQQKLLIKIIHFHENDHNQKIFLNLNACYMFTISLTLLYRIRDLGYCKQGKFRPILFSPFLLSDLRVNLKLG